MRLSVHQFYRKVLRRSITGFVLVAFGVLVLVAESFAPHLITRTLHFTALAAILLGYAILLFKYQSRMVTLGKAKTEAKWREQVLASAPVPYIAETTSGAIHVSPKLRSWVESPEMLTPDHLPNLLPEAARAKYQTALAALRTSQKNFALQTQLGNKPVLLRGQHCATGGLALWLTDLSEFKQIESGLEAEKAALAAELQQLKLMAEHLPRPIWLRKATGKIVWVNNIYAKWLDATPSEALERQLEFSARAEWQAALAIGRKAAESGSLQVAERHLVLDGKRRLFRITEQPIAAGGYVAGLALDITEVEEMRDELALVIEGYEQTLEQLQLPIVIFSGNQKLHFCNSAYKHLWQFEEAFIDEKPTYGDILEDLRARRKLPDVVDFGRYKRERLNYFTGMADAVEDLMHLPDGTTIRALVVPHPMGGIMIVTEDVTDKLALESSYNTLIAVQQETLDNLNEGVCVLGSDGRLKLYNPAFTKLWQLPEEAMEVGPHVTEILDQMRPLITIDQDWEKYRSRAAAELLNRTAGSRRYHRTNQTIVDLASVPLPDGNVLHTFVDVTSSVQVEQALRTTNKALAAADKLKSEFVANVSYQLRTPLSTIIGFAEILTNQYFGALNDRQMDYAKTILEASRKLLALINTVLDLATIEAGRMLLNRRAVPVAQLLQTATEMISGWAVRQQVTIDQKVAVGVDTVEVDERRLQQVLFNLLTNAVQYTPPGGVITLSAEPDGAFVKIKVVDTGIGMTEAELERVFGKFERANPNARQPGVGLGLSLVKALVELHGGEVMIESVPNQGTTVICKLPLAASNALPPAEVAA